MYFRAIAAILLFPLFSMAQYRLAPPLVKYDAVFFDSINRVELEFAHPGAKIRYTTNGSEPNSKSLEYKRPILLRENTTLIARTFSKGYIASESIRVRFFRSGLPYSIVSGTQPGTAYLPETGLNALNDNQGGNPNLKSGSWLGYDLDSIQITLQLKANVPVSRLMLHCLRNQSSWIFLPERVTVMAIDSAGNRQEILRDILISGKEPEPASMIPIEIPLTLPADNKWLRVTIYPVKYLPDWHAASGQHAWFFMDELKLY